MLRIAMRRNRTGCALAVALAFMPAPAFAVDSEMWPSIRQDLFGSRIISEDANAVILEAPARAEDAAIVPVSVTLPAAIAPSVKSLTLVVDMNPSPVVATFAFGPAAGTGSRRLSTRVRVNTYSHVRAIAETVDGRLLMAARFVKASGGCSAPALKDADEALANLGKTLVKTFPADGSANLPEGQVMIRHPNYSGMQMDPITRTYIPAKFVEEIEVKRGDDQVFRMTGGISLSEDPNLRFTYSGTAADTLSVMAKDTDGRIFTARSIPAGT